MSEMEILQVVKEGLAFLAAAGIIIDLTPGIKFQPVRYIIKRIGALMNHDIKEQLDKIEKDLLIECSSTRWKAGGMRF